MDIATDIVHDPKFRVVYKTNRAHYPLAITAYIAVLGESWKAGERVDIETGWPIFLAYDAQVVETMKEANLIDGDGRIPEKTWEAWFRPAADRLKRLRNSGRIGGLNSHGSSASSTASSTAEAPLQALLNPVRPSDRPTVLPTVGTVVVDKPRRATESNPVVGPDLLVADTARERAIGAYDGHGFAECQPTYCDYHKEAMGWTH